jgi:hypothetical protein
VRSSTSGTGQPVPFSTTSMQQGSRPDPTLEASMAASNTAGPDNTRKTRRRKVQSIVFMPAPYRGENSTSSFQPTHQRNDPTGSVDDMGKVECRPRGNKALERGKSRETDRASAEFRKDEKRMHSRVRDVSQRSPRWHDLRNPPAKRPRSVAEPSVHRQADLRRRNRRTHHKQLEATPTKASDDGSGTAVFSSFICSGVMDVPTHPPAIT